jgi:hypothetical protein
MFLTLILGWIQALFINGVRIDFKRGALSFLIPNLGKYIPGKILMFAGRIGLCRQMKIGLATSLGAITLEHIMLVAATLPFGAWMLLKGYFPFLSRSWPVIGVIAFIGLMILFQPSRFIRAVNWIMVRFKGTTIVSTPRSTDIILLFGIYLIGWIFYGLSGVVLAKAVGIENTPVDLIWSGFVIAWLIGFVSFITPGGLGVREVILCIILKDYVNTTQALAFAFIARILWTFVELFGSGISIFWLNSLRINRKFFTKKNS